jgi:hypothetical protein
LVLEGGGSWDCRQGIASVVAGLEAVVADGLIARAALDHGVPASLNRATVGTGLESGLGRFPVVAGLDAGDAHRGTIESNALLGM